MLPLAHHSCNQQLLFLVGVSAPCTLDCEKSKNGFQNGLNIERVLSNSWSSPSPNLILCQDGGLNIEKHVITNKRSSAFMTTFSAGVFYLHDRHVHLPRRCWHNRRSSRGQSLGNHRQVDRGTSMLTPMVIYHDPEGDYDKNDDKSDGHG